MYIQQSFRLNVQDNLSNAAKLATGFKPTDQQHQTTCLITQPNYLERVTLAVIKIINSFHFMQSWKKYIFFIWPTRH